MSSPGRAELTSQQALESRNLAAFKTAIARGEDVNAIDDYGFTPLLRACGNSNDYQIAKLLLKAPGIDVNKQTDGKPVAPLHIAAMHGNVGVLTLLLSDKRVDVNLRTNAACPVSALEKAIESGSSNQALMATLLVMAGATFDDSSKASLRNMKYPQQKATIEHVMAYQGAYRMFGRVFFPCVSLFNWVMDNKALSVGILATCALAVTNRGAITKMCSGVIEKMLSSSQGRSL